MKQIGLQMYTLRNFTQNAADYERTLEKVAEIGYRSLQTRTPSFWTAEEYKRILEHYGMTADSVFRSVSELEKDIDAVLAEAELFGTDVIRTDSIPGHLTGSAEGYKQFAADMDRIGTVYKKHGMKLIYHFHAFEFVRFEKERGIDILLNNTSSENLYFMPDVFWLTNAGTEPSVSLEMFDGRAFYMHVKDYAILPLNGKLESVPYTFASVGEGNLNWPGILKTADKIGITKYVVEQDECAGDVFEAIRTSFNSLRDFGIEA